MTSHPYSEDLLVDQPAIGLFTAMGLKTVPGKSLAALPGLCQQGNPGGTGNRAASRQIRALRANKPTRILTVQLPAHATLVPVSLEVTDYLDPKDNIFFTLAMTVDAELIVASDPHLTNLHPWRENPILPPAAFLVGIR